MIQSDSSVVKAMSHCLIDLEGENMFFKSEMISLKKKHNEDMKKQHEDMRLEMRALKKKHCENIKTHWADIVFT